MSQLIFEKEALYSMYDNSTELVFEILSEYISGFDKMLQQLKETSATQPTELSKLAHYYASGFKYVGFTKLQSDCHQLEILCSTGTAEQIEAARKELIIHIEATKPIIQTELSRITHKTFN